MKVTKQELYLVGFFHLANLAKDPFEAFIMNDMFKDQFIDLTKHRRDTLAFFTNEDSSLHTLRRNGFKRRRTRRQIIKASSRIC